MIFCPKETATSAGYGANLSEGIPLIPNDIPSRISTEITQMKLIEYKNNIPIEKITENTILFLIRVDFFTVFFKIYSKLKMDVVFLKQQFLYILRISFRIL